MAICSLDRDPAGLVVAWSPSKMANASPCAGKTIVFSSDMGLFLSLFYGTPPNWWCLIILVSVEHLLLFSLKRRPTPRGLSHGRTLVGFPLT